MEEPQRAHNGKTYLERLFFIAENGLRKIPAFLRAQLYVAVENAVVSGDDALRWFVEQGTQKDGVSFLAATTEQERIETEALLGRFWVLYPGAKFFRRQLTGDLADLLVRRLG